MTVFQLGIFALAAFIIGRLKQGRELAILAVSVFVVYWLQSPQQFVSLRFWLPTATLALTILCWLVVSASEVSGWKQNWRAALVIFGVMLLVDLNQFFGLEKIYMTATPRLWMMAAGISSYLLFLFLLARIMSLRGRMPFQTRRPEPVEGKQSPVIVIILFAIIFLFIYIKTPYLLEKSFDFIYSFQDHELSNTPYIFSWLGFSYIAFRLIHTLRDHQAGRLPTLTLSEYVNYVIFFPSFTAGPIDRAERFVQELRNPVALADQDWVEAGKRFFIGLFKKFVLADALALIALNDTLVMQTHSAAWMWFFLYAYSFRIYFDFSGYTDIAIGLARIMGFRLPENFAAPYLKSSLTQFWNSWHITLTQWFRAYFFNPITRALRIKTFPASYVIFIAQVSTMVVIGLWHGITWGFFLWGLWHGLGLFIQNRWSEFMRTRMKNPLRAHRQLLLTATGIFLTFNFVSLGWLFFTLSSPALAWQAFGKLFGVGL